MHYLLCYEKVPDYAAHEAAYQAAHREHFVAIVPRGELVLGGPLSDPVEGSKVLLFQADSADVATRFAKAGPSVVAGIV